MPNWRARGTKVMQGNTEVCKVNARRAERLVRAQLIAAPPELLAYLQHGIELDAEELRLAIEKAEGRRG